LQRLVNLCAEETGSVRPLQQQKLAH
jgi:hypothetical protein